MADGSRAPEPFYDALTVPFERLPAPRDVDPRLGLRVRRAVRHADLVHTHRMPDPARSRSSTALALS